MFIDLIKRIFAPAVMLIGRMWYWQKFLLITILFTIPIGFTLFSYIVQIDKNIAFAEKEIDGVHYLPPVLALLQDLQQHRGMASLYLRGDESFLPSLLEKEKKIKEDFARIDANDQTLGEELGTSDMLDSLEKNWILLKGNYPQLTPKESARKHTEFISDIFALLYRIGNSSNLVLDPDLDSYYLIITAFTTLPDLSENLGQARAFTLSIQDPKKISDAERRDIINYSKIARVAVEKLKRNIHIALAQNASLEALDKPLQDTISSVNSLAALLDTFINTSRIEISLAEYYAFSTVVINTNFSFSQSLSAALETLLRRRIDEFVIERQRIISITIFSYALILYVFIGFYLLVARTVRELERIAKQLTGGAATEVPVLSNDELGNVGKSFNIVGQALVASNKENIRKADELQKQSDEFGRMNQFMINREVKMSELKDELARLKEAHTAGNTGAPS